MFLSYDNKLYKNNGLPIIRNFFHCIDDLYFFSQNELDNFKLFYGIDSNDKMNLTCYAIDQSKPIDMNKKEKLVVCYDKHPSQVINFFEHFNKAMNNTYKLVIFYDTFNLPTKNVICLPRNELKLGEYLKKAQLFITFENIENTYYNILCAMKNNCLCMIPKFFKNLSNKCISFDLINNEVLTKVISIVSDSKKLTIYQNIYQKVIVNHINNNKWINL